MVGISFDSIRINGKDITIDSNDKLQEIFSLMALCLRYPPVSESASSPVTTLPHVEQSEKQTNFNPTIRSDSPPATTRTMDYAMKAAMQLGGNFTLRELADRMTHLGWKTRSKTERARTNTVRATIREYTDFVNYSNGRWDYKPNKLADELYNARVNKLDLDST